MCRQVIQELRVCPATTSPDELFGKDGHARDHDAAGWACRSGSRGVRRQGLPEPAETPKHISDSPWRM